MTAAGARRLTVPDPGMLVPASDALLEAVEHLVDGASLLGAELDAKYRVLALTIEVAPGRHPDRRLDDRRLQVLVHPASTFVVSLRVHDEQPRVEAFLAEQLADVVHALDGPTIDGPVFGAPEPAPGEWGPEPSLHGRSSALDGSLRTLRVEVVSGVRHFGLFATFDDLDVRRPDGTDVDLGVVRDGGPSVFNL